MARMEGRQRETEYARRLIFFSRDHVPTGVSFSILL